MMEALARAQLIIDEFEVCKQTTKKALHHTTTVPMKITLQLIDVEVRMALNEVEDSLTTAIRALTTLGVKMPQKATTCHMLGKLMKVKWMLKNKTDKDILNLPLTQDPLAAHAIRLLMNLCLFYLIKDEPITAIFSALLATELTLKKGLSQHSSGAFTFYGLAEVALGNINRAYRFGKLALTVLDRMDSREAECSTIGFVIMMLSFRKEPLNDLMEPLHKAAKAGFQYGDVVYATCCISYYHTIQIQFGTHLASVEDAMRQSYVAISELGQDEMLLWLQPAFQYVMNMQADAGDTCWHNIAVLSGEVMDEEQYFARALEINHTVLSAVGYIWKARIAVDFHQFSLAASMYKTCTKSFGTDAIKLLQGAASYYLDVAQTYYSLYCLSGRRYDLQQGRKHAKLLKRLEADGYPDVATSVAFLVAQEASIKYRSATDESMLRLAYTRGLNDLTKSRDLVLEARLNQVAGFDFASRGLPEEAERYFDWALHIYKYDWGAMAKYSHLEQKKMLALKGPGDTIPMDIEVASKETSKN